MSIPYYTCFLAIRNIALVQGAFSLVLRTREITSLALVQYFSVLHGNACNKVYVCSQVIVMQYSHLHTGGVGENAAKFTFTSVHVVVALPMSSKPVLQM